MYGGFVQRFKPRSTGKRRASEVGFDDIKKLRPRPFRPLVIVQDNATNYDVDDLLPEHRKDAEKYTLNVDQPDIEKDEDLMSIADDVSDMRRDSTDSMAPHGGSDFSRMDSVASVAPGGFLHRDSSLTEGGKTAEIAADKKKEEDKSKNSTYWNVTTIKYDKYNPVDETPHLPNVGREVAEMFEGENIQSKLPAAWKAVSARLTKKKDTGIMGVIKAAMAAKEKKPEVKKADTRPPKDQTKEFIKTQHGKRYHPVKWKPGVQLDLISQEDHVQSVYYMDEPYHFTYRPEVKLTEQDSLLCEEIAEKTERTDDPSKMIRRRYYRVLDNSSGDKKSHFIEQKTLIDDEDYKLRKMLDDESQFLQHMISPRRDSHIHFRMIAHDAINPQKLKTKTPILLIRRPAGVPNTDTLVPFRLPDDKAPNTENFKQLPLITRRVQPKESSDRHSVTEPFSLVAHNQVDTRDLMNKPAINTCVQPKFSSQRNSITVTYELISHDQVDTRNLLRHLGNLDRILLPKRASDVGGWSSPFELAPHDATDQRLFHRKSTVDKRLQPKNASFRGSVTATFELISHDAEDTRDLQQQPDITTRMQPKKSTERGSVTSPYELTPHDAEDTRILTRRPTVDKRIQPKELSDRGSMTSPFELTPHDADDTRLHTRRPTVDKRLQPKELSNRGSVTSPFELTPHNAEDTRLLTRRPTVEKRLQPKELSGRGSVTSPFELTPHDAEDTRLLTRQPTVDKRIQPKELSNRGSVSSPYELTPHDADDTRLHTRIPTIDKRIQPKRMSERGSVTSPFELTPHDAEDTRLLTRRPTIDKRIQPTRLSERGSVTSPFELIPHNAVDNRLFMRKSDAGKRIQPKIASERSSITAHYNLVADDAVDNRNLMRQSDIERRSQAKEVSETDSITFPFLLVAHDAINTLRLIRWPTINQILQPKRLPRTNSFDSEMNLVSHCVLNVYTQLVRKPQTHRVIRPVEISRIGSFSSALNLVNHDAIDVRLLTRMGDKIKHIQANEANIGVELQELEIAEPRVIPLDQLPRIKHGSDFQSLSIVRGWCSVIREFDHLHWTSDCDVQLIRRKRANIIQYLMRYHTAIMYTFMTECFCEPFKPHIFVPRRALMTINERLLSTVVKVGFTAEEEVEIYENPLLYQKKAIMLTVFVFHYVAVHKELLTQQLNQEVAPYMIRKLLPIVTTHQHILKTAIARRWEVEEEIDGVKIQVVDRKTTAFKPHRPYNFKSAPLSDRMIYENADTKSINKTIVDVAGEYKIVLPYTLPQGSAGLLREALDKVVKEANINEPFYMRHIYASKNSPDQIIIIPRSMVDRGSPRKVPTWQAPTRPAQYPRISTMTKAYNPEHIPDLSVPTADKRLIRSKQKHGPLFDSATNKVYDQLEGADTLSYVNTKTPAVKRRFQKELPKLMDHTDFVEIHNYGSKRGRRRVRIPKTRVKTVPLEFEDVGTTTGEISRWLPEGQIQQLGHVQVSKDQEITRIDDYLDEAPISNYVASPFEYTDQQKVLKVARTKPRKVKIAQKGRQAAELEELLVEELAEQTNEQFSMKRLRGRKILTKPRQLGQQWQHPLENYTERYVYDPITERLEEYFNTFPNDLPIMAEYMAANDPEPANDAYAPQKAKAQKRRNMRRYYAARHKRRLKDEYADHHNEKLRPIDLIALRPKSFKYQVLSQIPSAAPYTEMDEYGLYKNVYIDEVPVKQVAGYDHRESGNRAMLESAQSALGTGDNEAIDSVNVVSGPKVLIHESQKNAAEKSAIVTRETIDPSKPQKVFLDSVPHEQSGRHHELDFTKNTHQEYVVAGTAGDIERVPVHKRIKAKKVMQTMRQSPGTEWTPINEAVQTNEPYYTKKIKAKKVRGPYLKSALKYNPTLEEIAEEHPPDLSLRSPDVEKYIYGGGLLSHERYEMEPEEWTGDAGSYNLMTERIGYKNTKPLRKQVGQQTSRVRKEYVEAYIAEEPFTYTPDITHDMELTQQFIQHADKVETVPLSQIGPSLQPTDLYQPDVTDHLFDGYSISRNVQHLYAENPDQDTASPVNVINESTTPELYKYTKKYIPNDWPAAPIGTQTDINELPDTVTIRAVLRDLPVEEEIYGGWYDSTTNHWIIDTADGNVAIRAADIRLVRHKEVERDLSQHLSRTIYEKRKRLPKKPGLAAVRLDSTSPTRYYDYMFTSPDRVMITPDEHSPHKPRIAIGRTQGRPFTEELRSGADGVHWSPTGIPDQGRIKKIQRVRLMPKRYIGEPQHTADKIEMIEPKYTGPGVPKQRRYQPKVHDYHVTPSGTAMMEKSTQLRRTERRPDVELNRQFVKGQRFFDDPYSMPESAELHKQELTARKPSAVRRYRPRQARTMTTDATSIGREFIPIQQSYRTKLARLDKKIRQPMSYMDHLTQTSVGKELVSEQQLDPYFIPKQTVGQVWPKKMNLLVNPYNKDRGMSEEVNTDNRSSTSATEQSYHVNPAAGESRQRQHRHNVGATWQFETKY